MKIITPLSILLIAILLLGCNPTGPQTQAPAQPTAESAVPVRTILPATDTPAEMPALPIVYYYFIAMASNTFPAGSVVILPGELVLGPTLSDYPRSRDTVSNIRSATQAMLDDPRNAWKSDEIDIKDINFIDGDATVALEGDYSATGDVVLMAARYQVLFTVFAEASVQTAVITLNGVNIANLGISHSSEAKPDDYAFTRAEVEAFMTENAYAP